MQRLTKAEEDLMQLFWDAGPTTISDLIQRMENPKPPHSTVSSIARILEKKGFLGHKKYGRTYEYFPLIDRISYKKFSLKKLTGSYFNGSPEQLVSFLVKEEKLDKEKLRLLIEDLEKQKQ